MQDKIDEVNKLIDELAEEAKASGCLSIHDNILKLKSTITQLKNDDRLTPKDKEFVIDGILRQLLETLDEIKDFNKIFDEVTNNEKLQRKN
jgi:hypothetical protein